MIIGKSHNVFVYKLMQSYAIAFFLSPQNVIFIIWLRLWWYVKRSKLTKNVCL